MSSRRAAAAAASAIALAAATVVVVRPALVLDADPAVRAAIESLDPSVGLLALLGVLALLTLYRGAAGRSAAAPPSPLTVDADAATTGTRALSGRSGEREPIGAELDRRFETATAYEDVDRARRERAREAIEDELREVATVAYARRAGCDRETAAAAVAAGEWTTAPRAAAFLADEDGPSTPLGLWLVDLLLGRDPFRRGAERTVEEIRALQREVGSAPTPDRAPAGDQEVSAA